MVRTLSIVVQSVTPLVLVELFSFPPSAVGYVIAGYWIANGAGTIFALGVIKKPRFSTLLGFLILAVCLSGFAVSTSSILFEFWVVLSGLGLAILQAFLVPSMYSMGEGDRPHSGIGMYSVALSMGLISGPLLGSALVRFYGYDILFLVLSGLAVLMLAASKLSTLQRTSNKWNSSLAASPSAILSMFRHRGFANIYAQNFLYSLLLPIFVTYGGIFAGASFGVSTSTALILFTGTFVVSTLIRIVYTRMRIHSFHIVLAIGFVCLAVSFILIGAAKSFPLFLFGFLLYGVPHALVYPSMTFVALETGGAEGVVSTSYLFATSSGVAEFVAPLAAVPIIIRYGLGSVFILMAIVPLIALAVLVSMPMDIVRAR